jgi:hypothetical protein
MFALNAVGAGCYVLQGPPQITGLDHNPAHNTKSISKKYFIPGRHKFGCDRAIIEGNLLGERCASLAVFWLPQEGFS